LKILITEEVELVTRLCQESQTFKFKLANKNRQKKVIFQLGDIICLREVKVSHLIIKPCANTILADKI
jgi:hypothetical protein